MFKTQFPPYRKHVTTVKTNWLMLFVLGIIQNVQTPSAKSRVLNEAESDMQSNHCVLKG
jgi:hypothetical protein